MKNKLIKTKSLDKELETKNALDRTFSKKLYGCKECNMLYKEKELAEKCEDWCRKHKSCNLEIIKHAVKAK